MQETTELPRSETIDAARELLDEAPAAVKNHSIRTFLLGRAYARVRRIDFDEEGLCIAALFHDFGLFPHHLDRKKPFTQISSELLDEFLEDRAVAASKARVLKEAILLHMQPLPRWSRGPTAGLLQVGAWMDATGLRKWRVRRTAREIERAFPRLGFSLSFPPLLIKSIGSPRVCLDLFRGKVS
jgi:hypothetical protein